MDTCRIDLEQVVRIRPPLGGWRLGLCDFVVVYVFICEGCDTLYRVRSIADGHERIVIEGEIRPAARLELVPQPR